MSHPYGPSRKCVEVLEEQITTQYGPSLKKYVVLECGHKNEMNVIYSYFVGDTYHCMACKGNV